MTIEERIGTLEAKIDKVQKSQTELYKQLVNAQREQWQSRIDELEVQVHLAAAEANDRVHSLMGLLRKKWDEARNQFDETASTALGVTDTLRSGLENAAQDVRKALLESKKQITS
ncbi:MAG: hypothetical protein ABI746_06705 [Dermatophilaceae bacterium]